MLLSFIPGNDFEEIVKVPAMLAHYNQHDDQKTGHLGFFEFLNMHYGQSIHKHESHQHQDLPFYNHQLAPSIFLISAFESKMPLTEYIVVPSVDYLPYIKNGWLFQPEFDVFNPPRV